MLAAASRVRVSVARTPASASVRILISSTTAPAATIANVGPTPVLLVFSDHDSVSQQHIAEFFALFGGGVQDAGWEGTPKYARARLAIVPGYTHYNFGQGPDIARVIEGYLTNSTSEATQFSPE